MSTISASTTLTTAFGVTGDTTGTLVFQTGATPTTALTISSSQNVGIGTSSPLAKLSIGAGSISDSNVPIQMNAVASTGSAYMGFNNAGGYGLLVGYDNSVGYARVRNISNTALTFSTNDVERMRIDSGGNVCIGGSAPSGYSLLHLKAADNPVLMVEDIGNGVGYFSQIGAVTNVGAEAALTFTTNVSFGSGPAVSGVERMRIDASGRITQPYQPAFVVAAAAGAATYTGGAKVLYNQAQQNAGSYYSTANSRFTAPVAGFYLFKAQVWSYSTNPSATRFGINGSSVWGSYGNEATQIGFNGYVLVEIFYLNANDYVEVFNRIGTTYTDGMYSLFSGYLLG